MKPLFRPYFSLCLVCTLCVTACSTHRAVNKKETTASKIQIAEYQLNGLKYQVYQMPQEKGATKKQQNKTDKNIKLSIMVVNMNSDNASPLRRLCSNLEEYNIKNEYLLNSAKNDIYLVASDNTIKYPVYYAFENNYNAFPFETINVGYAFKNNETKKMKKIKLVYIDRIFSNDSIFFNLNLNQ